MTSLEKNYKCNSSLLEKNYIEKVIPQMKKVFGYKNNLAAPKIEKIVLSIGTGSALKDAELLKIMEETLKKITGQMPVATYTKKAIASFKTREGMKIGLKVTLRKKRMYFFLEKLINVALPRTKDFKGLSPKSFDGNGNYTIGVKEHLIFPEIDIEQIKKIHGLEIIIVTTAKTDKEGLELLKLTGLPFQT